MQQQQRRSRSTDDPVDRRARGFDVEGLEAGEEAQGVRRRFLRRAGVRGRVGVHSPGEAGHDVRRAHCRE